MEHEHDAKNASTLAARGVLGDQPQVALRMIGREIGWSDRQTDGIIAEAPLARQVAAYDTWNVMARRRTPNTATMFLVAAAAALSVDVDQVYHGLLSGYGHLLSDRPHFTVSA